MAVPWGEGLFSMNAGSLKGRAAASINLVGGRLCLDFVNTVGARRVAASGRMTIRDEKLTSYLDLVVWGEHAGALDHAEAKALARAAVSRPHQAGRVLYAARRLREALYRVFKNIVARRSPARSDMAVLNQELRAARNSEVFTTAGERFTWKWKSHEPDLRKVPWAVVLSAAELLSTDDLGRLHQCGGDDCGWLFLDLTRNRSRHWCDMRDCGNRDRVRRFRMRQRRRARASQRLVNRAAAGFVRSS